jgi:hypothetical protein
LIVRQLQQGQEKLIALSGNTVTLMAPKQMGLTQQQRRLDTLHNRLTAIASCIDSYED